MAAALSTIAITVSTWHCKFVQREPHKPCRPYLSGIYDLDNKKSKLKTPPPLQNNKNNTEPQCWAFAHHNVLQWRFSSPHRWTLQHMPWHMPQCWNIQCWCSAFGRHQTHRSCGRPLVGLFRDISWRPCICKTKKEQVVDRKLRGCGISHSEFLFFFPLTRSARCRTVWVCMVALWVGLGPEEVACRTEGVSHRVRATGFHCRCTSCEWYRLAVCSRCCRYCQRFLGKIKGQCEKIYRVQFTDLKGALLGPISHRFPKALEKKKGSQWAEPTHSCWLAHQPQKGLKIFFFF